MSSGSCPTRRIQVAVVVCFQRRRRIVAAVAEVVAGVAAAASLWNTTDLSQLEN